MTREEILARFNTPSQIKVDEIQSEIKKTKLIIKQLEEKINKLHKKSNEYWDKVNSEGNTAANKLDKDFPDWRMILIKGEKPEQ